MSAGLPKKALGGVDIQSLTLDHMFCFCVVVVSQAISRGSAEARQKASWHFASTLGPGSFFAVFGDLPKISWTIRTS